MEGFYNVHCTECGHVLTADKMAINIDRLLNVYLSQEAGGDRNSIIMDAQRIFKQIKIGMFLTRQEMISAGILDEGNALRLTCQCILDFIGRKYGVNFNDIKTKVKEEIESSYLLSIEEEFGEGSNDFYHSKNKTDKIEFAIPTETIDRLCSVMLPYSQLDGSEEKKKKCIEDMLQLLLRNREEILLKGKCRFDVNKDDMGREFVSSCKVEYENESGDFEGMVCPECGEELFEDAGKYEEHVIVMLGSSRVGKTAYLAALVDTIEPEYGQLPCKKITIKNTNDKKYSFFKRNILSVYREGKKIPKTDESKEAVALFSLEVGVREKTIILTFVDLPGEVFALRTEEEKKNGMVNGNFIIRHKKICKYADIFWLCVDPVQIDKRLLGFNEKMGEADKVDQDIQEVLANIGRILRIMGNNKTDMPMAAIITKSDLLAEQSELYKKDEDSALTCLLEDGSFSVNSFNSMSNDVQKYMQSDNVKNIITQLPVMFSKLNYFSVAAYGANFEGSTEKVQKAPRRILLPFLWSLAVLGYITPVKLQIEYKKTIIGKGKPYEHYVKAEEEELFFDQKQI